MRFNKKTFLIFQILFFFFIQEVFSQNSSTIKINYYGIVSTDLDNNMSKMTSDLYLTQLSEISSVEVQDLRNVNNYSSLENINFLSENINLYFFVKKQENNSKWFLTIYLHNNNTNKTLTETKEYDSFYKILMEPKSSLQETLKTLLDYNSNTKSYENSNSSSSKNKQTDFPEFNKTEKFISTEEFSGTWSGETYIDKIVILRGGRGFVIFNNGASMNISVRIEENTNSLVIKQISRANASFFPNLDRQQVLEYISKVAPIEWNFTIINSDTLSGTKKTLVQSSDGLNVVQAEVNVTWSRKL